MAYTQTIMQKNKTLYPSFSTISTMPNVQMDNPQSQYASLLEDADKRFAPKFSQVAPATSPFGAGSKLNTYAEMLRPRQSADQGLAEQQRQLQPFVNSEGVKGRSPAVDTSSMVGFAQSMLGKPYIWGGTDPNKGVDCSGLTLNAAKTVGLKLPRTAAAQSSWFKEQGRSINDINQAKPGDLLYFRSSGPSGWHTGVYIGGGKMIHAAGRKYGVITSNIGKNYLSRLVNIGVV